MTERPRRGCETKEVDVPMDDTPSEMERAKAARSLLVDARKHDGPNQAQEEMAAFMAIFHPGHEVPAVRDDA